MSDSTWDDPTITAYVLGELSDDERDEFESKMECSSELAAAVEEVRSVTGQLGWPGFAPQGFNALLPAISSPVQYWRPFGSSRGGGSHPFFIQSRRLE